MRITGCETDYTRTVVVAIMVRFNHSVTNLCWIPLLARITAIADVYDALTSRRSYREPMTHSTARDFIMARAGTHFDPACTLVWSDLTKNGALPEVLDTSWRVALYTQSDKIS